ncbi:MAG: hypothetical protein ACLR1A_04365 [Eubacterium ventriosum]
MKVLLPDEEEEDYAEEVVEEATEAEETVEETVETEEVSDAEVVSIRRKHLKNNIYAILCKMHIIAQYTT